MIRIKIDRDPLSAEQNKYATKIVNACIVYDLDAWSKNLTKYFKFINCLFGVTSIVKNSDKEKWVYSGYGITFDDAGSWHFGNEIARNVVIFGVDKSSSSHTDNRKINFLLLGEGLTYDINGSFGSPDKRFSINFASVKPIIKMFTFQLNFVLEANLTDLVLLSLGKYL